MASELTPLISASEIQQTVKRLAQEIDQDYRDRSPILIGILKGAFIFLSDLVRHIQNPIQRIELIRLSSYGSGTSSSGQVKVLLDLPEGLITHQDVILVEDIVDTGLSTSKAIALLTTHHPASLKLYSLLDKPARRQVKVTIDYLGLTVPDKFIVGYGIDWDERYRQLPDIRILNQCTESAY